MKYFFPHYVYGMLQTSDKKNVYGDLQPIAYSREFSGNLQREIYKKFRLGLSGDLLQESRHAYGFFPLSEDDFFAVHYELMDLTEPTSRGKPVFSEFLHITLSQLQDINWNLFPIFESFTNIPYYAQIAKDISTVEIEINNEDQRLESLRQFPVQVEAILVRYLSSPAKINIISSPDNNIRLKTLCELAQCLPLKYRKDLSFATLAKETSDSVKIFFSAYPSVNGQVVDWSAPTVPNLSGIVYANWLNDLVQASKTGEIKGRVSNLVLPWKTDHLKTYGDEVDLAIRYRDWASNRNEHLKINVIEQLEQLAKQINEFSCIFNSQEAEDWLSVLLIFVMKLTAYDVAVESLSNYTFMIADDNTRQRLVQKIVDEIFIQQKEGGLRAITDFIVYITEHGIKTNQNVLLGFCQEILLQCLVSENYPRALRLWGKIKHLDWASSPIWFKSGLERLPSTLTTEDLVFIVNDIGCPPDKQVFEYLLVLLERSPALLSSFPENVLFLKSLDYDEPQKYLEHVSKSFSEVKSFKWISTQIRFGYNYFSGFPEVLPFLVERIGIMTVDNLLLYAISEKDDFLTVFIVFSKILNQIQRNNSAPINKYLKPIKECSPEYINAGLVVLQSHWKLFSIEQLELFLNILDIKPGRYQNISLSAKQIRTTIQKKNRIIDIQSVFKRKIKKNDLGHIIFEFVAEFLRSGDIDAWRLFEKLMQDRRLSNEYHRLLIQILLENQFFKVEDEKLKEISILLDGAELVYEADVFIYWLFFRRGLFISPIPSIIRTLNLHNVQPFDAGIIIGQENTFNKKHFHSLADKLVSGEPEEAEKLAGILDAYVLKKTTNSFENRIKALVSGLTPDVVWIENCKSLSKYIKSELTHRRN